VDGVYDSDPKKNPAAKKFDEMSYMDTINLRLTVMDPTAITMCMEHKLPILVLNLWDVGALKKALFGDKIGTIVH
jgi:uridylate kinase